MLELLGLVLGGALRLAPEIFKLFTAKRDADHEYRMTQLQLQIDQARANQALDQIAAKGAMEQASLELSGMIEAIKAQGARTGIAWVDAISSTVRPFLTYWWCVILYTTAKVMMTIVAVQQSAKLEALVPILVTDFDRAVIASIISFWFVDRSLRRPSSKV